MKNLQLIYLFWLGIFNVGFYSFGQTWFQKGPSIYGQAAQDYCGENVSISGDGSTIAVGAVGNDQAGSNAGNVRVFQWNGTTWVQKGIDLTGDFSEDAAGQSLAINYDGSTVVVGLAGYDTPLNSGQVRIYGWSGTAWLLKGTPINGEVSSSYSGRSVSISDDGNRVAIGARYNSENGSNTGQVEVYDWNGTDWIQAGTDLNGDSNGDWFGEPVVLSSDGAVLAVGATQLMGTLPHLGYVKLYEWNGSNWIQKGATVYGANSLDVSGGAVALSYSGDTLAVGSPENSDNGTDAGHVRVFYWTGTTWSPLGTTLIGANANDHLGTALSMSSDGTRLAVGAYGLSNNTGRLTIFEYDGTDWAQLGNYINGSAINDYFSMNDMTNDGDALIVSGAGNDFFATNAGKIQVFELCEPTTSFLSVNACDSYTVPSGEETYALSGTYLDTVLNTKGCDSLITINLTLNNETFSTISASACFKYLSPGGNLYTNSGTYTEIITNQAGCDSNITLNVTINNISASVIIQDDSLLAMPNGSTYQWYDCNTNSILPGQTQQTFSPISPGNYAVITQGTNGCIDTSNCQAVNLGITSLPSDLIQLYPNPVSNDLYISVDNVPYSILLTDMSGKQLHYAESDQQKSIVPMNGLPAGNYLITIECNNKKMTRYITKSN
jgi:Secretion system C-terminal sorting domain/FG-GAP repeat